MNEMKNIQPNKNIQPIDSIKWIIWQRGYYENIIRNADSYRRISAYIINNPANWSADKFSNNIGTVRAENILPLLYQHKPNHDPTIPN